MHRPDVPERVCADAPVGRGGGLVFPQGAGQSGALVGAHGADDEPLRRGSEALRGRPRDRRGPLRAARTQGRADPGVSARLRGRRGRAVYRRGAGEGAGGAHPAAGRSGARPVSVAGVVDGDGQPPLRLPGGCRVRAAVRQVLLVLPVQREALHQRPRVPQAAVVAARRRVRGAGQRHRELRRPGSHAAPGRRARRVPGSTPCCASGWRACRTRSPAPTGRRASATTSRCCRPSSP